jgi:hypothetical protein
MPTVTSVSTVDYVAQILDEHPDLIHAIISNEDNLSYGAIITVRTGPEEGMDALTDDGIDGWCNARSGNSFGVWSLSPCRGMPRQGLPNLVFHGVEPTMEKQEWTD